MQTKASDSQRQRQVKYFSFTHNDVIEQVTSLAHIGFKVDARERDLGEILMQVKKTQKIMYRSIYTSSYIIIVVVDCQKTANSRLTSPW